METARTGKERETGTEEEKIGNPTTCREKSTPLTAAGVRARGQHENIVVRSTRFRSGHQSGATSTPHEITSAGRTDDRTSYATRPRQSDAPRGSQPARGRSLRPVLVALAAARVGVAARPSRHRLDALEVDEQVDGADHGRQRRHDDQRQHGHRHGRRRGARGCRCAVDKWIDGWIDWMGGQIER